MDVRLVARMLAAVRIGIGVGVFAAPRTSVRLMLRAEAPGVGPVLARGLGARDIVIGVGQLVTLDDDGEITRWLDAGVVADTADGLAAVLSRRALSTASVLSTVAMAASSAATALWLKRELAGSDAAA